MTMWAPSNRRKVKKDTAVSQASLYEDLLPWALGRESAIGPRNPPSSLTPVGSSNDEYLRVRDKKHPLPSGTAYL